MKNIGVIFTSKKLTSKNGKEYFSGKLEGSEGFNLMAFVGESAKGVKYLSLVEVEDVQVKENKEEAKVVTQKPVIKSNKDNTEKIIDPDDLPF